MTLRSFSRLAFGSVLGFGLTLTVPGVAADHYMPYYMKADSGPAVVTEKQVATWPSQEISRPAPQPVREAPRDSVQSRDTASVSAADGNQNQVVTENKTYAVQASTASSNIPLSQYRSNYAYYEGTQTRSTETDGPLSGFVVGTKPNEDAERPKLPSIPALGLGTLPGIEFGLNVSSYKYEEPSLGVKLDGTKFGLNLIGSTRLNKDYFMTGDMRFSFGDSDYYSVASGSSSDNPERLFDVRASFGRDFLFERVGLSPYLGLAYRYLYSDSRGETTHANTYGYRRENDLIYTPMGFDTRLRIDGDSRVSMRLEYDFVWMGTQTSTLSDVSSTYPDLENEQSSGSGYRVELAWETPRWSIGPFFSYWDIPDSDTVTACTASRCVTGLEPENNTVEYGLQARYRP